MQRKKITPFHVMNSLLLGLLAILCLLPIAHVIALSFSDSSEVALRPRGAAATRHYTGCVPLCDGK